VLRLRRYLASFSLAPVGIVTLAVLVVALFLFAIGPSGIQMPALVVAVILLVGVVGGVPFGGNRGGARRDPSFVPRPREFDPVTGGDSSAPTANTQAEDELWRKERERYARDRQSK
jgi:hypothetical protein